MIELIQKLVIMWEKKKVLTLAKIEEQYVLKNFGHIALRDEKPLRVRIAEIQAIKQPSEELKKEAVKIGHEINEIMKYKGMLVRGDQMKKDLIGIIEVIKKDLW